MNALYDIKDIMEDELKQMSKKEQLTKEDVCLIGEMVDVVKDIETIEAMKDAAAQGWSRDYARDYANGYSEEYSNAYGNMYRTSYDNRRGRDNDNDGRYSEDGSYRRGRDSMGRYTSRDGGSSYRGNSYEDGYSRHSKEEMIKNLEQMMRDARTPEERESYRSTIEQMQMSK